MDGVDVMIYDMWGETIVGEGPEGSNQTDQEGTDQGERSKVEAEGR